MMSLNDMLAKHQMIEQLEKAIVDGAFEYAKAQVQHGQVVFAKNSFMSEKRVVFMLHHNHTHFHEWNGKPEVSVLTYPLRKNGTMAKIGYYNLNLSELSPIRDKNGNLVFAKMPED